MAASTIPAAKAALISAIAARPALAGVTVTWAIPADLPITQEAIYVDDAVEVRRAWVALGALTLDESYVLRVRVETMLYGGTQRQAVEERLWVLVNEVEQAVRSDIKLAGVLTRSTGAKPDGVEPVTQPTDEGWWATAIVRIACAARI